jgi:hypothetical protein
MAGFEAILYGRFWVITEDNAEVQPEDLGVRRGLSFASSQSLGDVYEAGG